MYVNFLEKDVATVYEWYGGVDYKASELPKIPLLIAALVDIQANQYKSVILKDDWREVGWYPGCHYKLDDPRCYRVTLFCKEQDTAPLGKKLGEPWYDLNTFCNLGCSCVSYKKMPKLTAIQCYHRTLGIHRREKPTKLKTYNNWHRFATTPLASYWFWGLLPDETDRHKYE